MNFGLSEEQELLQETVRGFVAGECPPTRLREIFDGESGTDATLWNGMLELGLGGLALPERYGGAGLALVDLALVAEVLGAGAVPGPFLGHVLAGLAIALGGSDAQKEAWLPRLAMGEVLGSVAFAEDEESWAPDGWTTRCEDGRVTGRKAFVSQAEEAGILVVGLAGGGVALVEASAAGVKVEPLEGVDRTRRFGRVSFENAEADLLAGGEAQRVIDAGSVLLAADAFGGAWKLVEDSVAYAKTREQFGQPIAQFQAVKHRLADMALQVEPARGLYWYAAYAFDHLPDDSTRAAALAKSHVTERFMEIARDAVEVHGGLGFTWECDVQIYFKRAMFDRAFLGSPSYHRERAAALASW